MKIVIVPHPSLREVAKQVQEVDKKLIRFVGELEKTLHDTKNPKGVGLAATQVNAKRRVFATQLNRSLRSYINPRIVKHDKKQTLGPNKKEPYLEGCLSIPGIYGPVPRHGWVDLEFQTIQDGRLVTQVEHFDDFDARVIQHELDHLDGILFTDYTKKLDLPLYQENKETNKLDEVDPSIIEIL